MSKRHLDPAKSIIDKIGIETMHAVTGKHVSRIYRWMYSKERGGTGGIIPQADAASVLALNRSFACRLLRLPRGHRMTGRFYLRGLSSQPAATRAGSVAMPSSGAGNSRFACGPP